MTGKTATNHNTEELFRIERALDALLTAALAARPFPRAGDERPRLIGQVLEDILSASKAKRAADEILENPVGEMARQGVRVLGERLHEIGGMRLMEEVLYRVAARDPSREGHLQSLMDYRWDGVGRSPTSAGWCA